MSTIISNSTMQLALPYCKGIYQERLVMGYQCLSGSDLKGKARRFSGKYSWSRVHLLARLEKAGFIVTEIKGDHGERILVIASVEEVLREV